MELVLNLHRSLCLWYLSPARGRGSWVRGGGGEGVGGCIGGDGSDCGGESAEVKVYGPRDFTCWSKSRIY